MSEHVLTLRPGDFLVLETDENVPPEQAEDLRRGTADIFGVDEAQVVVICNARLKVLRKDVT